MGLGLSLSITRACQDLIWSYYHFIIISIGSFVKYKRNDVRFHLFSSFYINGTKYANRSANNARVWYKIHSIKNIPTPFRDG